MMRKVLFVLVVLASFIALTAALNEPTTKHVIETPKGKVEISIHKDGASEGASEGAPAAAESSEASAEASAPSETSAPAESSEASAESSQASEESSEAAEPATPNLSKYVLPPEPASAKGYKSPDCGGDDPCKENQENDSVSLSAAPSVGVVTNAIGAEPAGADQTSPCTENCDAEAETPHGALVGGEFMSQPVGSLDASSGLDAVPNTQIYSDNKVGSGNDMVTVPQTGVSLSPASKVGSTAAEPVSSSSSSSSDAAGSAYESPELIKAKRLADLAKKEAEERESEKTKLHSELDQHMQLLSKINEMGRALKFQYAELRRHHNMVRTAIAANKASLNELGGDDQYEGTDYDIEAPIKEDVYGDLEDLLTSSAKSIDDKKPHPWETELENHVKAVLKVQEHVQAADQSAQRNIIRNLMGDKKLPVLKGDKPSKPMHNKHLAKIKNLIENMKQVSKPTVARTAPVRKMSTVAKEIEEALANAEKVKAE